MGSGKGGARPAGFTLIELLTVVAIIALLIGILLPSLSRARDQARRTKVAALLDSIGKALEMFHNDFHHYPDSRVRRDPIDWGGWRDFPDKQLSGAHWLARALFGHDMGGVDARGYVMIDAGAEGPGLPDTLGTAPLTLANLAEGGPYADRRGVYMEGELLAADTDRSLFPGTPPINTAGGGNFGFRPTGRPVVREDAYGSPVLYYRANPTGRQPVCCHGGIATVNAQPIGPGVYNQYDNCFIAGRYENPDGTGGPGDWGWDFSGRGEPHRLGCLGTWDPQVFGDETRTFAYYLHDRSAWKTFRTIKPVRRDSFVLITAGKDQVFGTGDDITNFDSGL